MTLADIGKMLAPLRTRILNMVARAGVQVVDDSKKIQILQLGVLADETRSDVERFQNYGFTSVPQDGAEAVVIFVGGRRDHGLAVAVDDRRYRKTGLQPGEVAVYTDQGDSIVIKRGGTIEITAATKVKINASDIELGGNTDALALASHVKAALDDLKSTFNNHTHAAGSFTTSGGSVTGTSGSGPSSGVSTVVASSTVKAV